MRFYLSESASTNYWEKGPLLHELTRIVKDNYKKQTPAGNELPATTAVPTNTAPATAAEPAQTWTPPTAKTPAFVAPKLAGKDVNTLQGNNWKSADELEKKFDNRHDVSVEEETGDKDVNRLQKLAGIRSYMSKGI